MLAAKIVQACEAILRSVIIARFLGIELYAVYALVPAFVRPVQELFNANVGAAVVKYGTTYQQLPDQRKFLALLKMSYLITLLLYVIFVVCMLSVTLLLAHLFFAEVSVRGWVFVFACCSGLTLFDLVGKSILRLFDLFRVNAITEMAVAMTGLVIVVGVTRTQQPSIEVVLSVICVLLAVGAFIRNAVVFWEMRRELVGLWQAPLRELQSDRRRLFEFIMGNSLSRTLERSTRGLDVLMLGALASPAAVAIYDVSKKLSGMFLLLKDPLALAAYPQIAEGVAVKDTKRVVALLKGICQIVLVPAVTVLVLFSFSSEAVLGIWGSGFQNAGWTPALLMVRTMVALALFWAAPLALSLEMIRFQLIVRVGAVLCSFVLGWVLIQPLGAAGMAAGMLIGTTLGTMFLAYSGVRQLRRYTISNP